jgi:flagellar protein FlaF
MKSSQAAADREQMLNAARLNWRLWTILQAELLNPQSPVPADVRDNVLSLARFIDGRMLDFIAEPEPAKLDPLIAINRELAAGLFTEALPPSAAAQGNVPVRTSA